MVSETAPDVGEPAAAAALHRRAIAIDALTTSLLTAEQAERMSMDLAASAAERKARTQQTLVDRIFPHPCPPQGVFPAYRALPSELHLAHCFLDLADDHVAELLALVGLEALHGGHHAGHH